MHWPGDGDAADIPVNTFCQISCPVLLVHSRQDATVPLTHAIRILQCRGAADASLIELDSTHESFTDMEQAMHHLRQFLDTACAVVPRKH